MNKEQLQNISKLEPSKRYNYFIKKVVDFNEMYLLENKVGLATYIYENKVYVPIWSEYEIAGTFINEDFSACTVEKIDLDELLNDLLPMLKEQSIGIAVFPVDNDRGIICECDFIEKDIKDEMCKYE